ncbi:MAG TPA: phage tail sheath subtilisin-like domain-containing protein [Polyangiaceae bacterium]|nr:phage tail sheath subtilisin-like domain-containing protein [Polyangiaceae bacterium]
MSRLHPGVYLEEVPSAVRPIEGVSTSTAGFIGKSERGPLGQPKLITSFAEFSRNYGTFLGDSHLAHSVLQFFNNGGRMAYVLRVAGSGAAAAAITVRDRNTAPQPTLTVSAANEGAWGNALDLEIVESTIDPDNLFTLRVLRDRSMESPPLPPLLLETHVDLSMDEKAPNFVEKVVGQGSAHISASVETANLANAVAGTSRGGKLRVGNGAGLLKLGVANGGTEVSGTAGSPGTSGTSESGATPALNPPADRRRLVINLDGDGPREITVPGAANTGPAVAQGIRDAVRALVANDALRQPAYDDFTCEVNGSGNYLLTSGTVGPTSSVVVTSSAETPFSLPAGTHRFTIEIDNDGPHLVTLTGPFVDGNAIAAAITAAITSTTPKRNANLPAFVGFSATYENAAGALNPSLLLTGGTADPGSSVRVTDGPSNNVAGLLKLGLTNGGIEVSGSAALRPALSAVPTEYHLGDAVVSGNVTAVAFGADGATPGDSDYDLALRGFDTVRDVNILCVPGITTPAVIAAGAAYCNDRMDCFFIGDVPFVDDTPEEARTFVNGLTVKNSYGAVYYPWLKMTDPTGQSSQPLSVPPSGFIAGLYARTDARRGVFKAPAGTEANLAGAVGLVSETTDTQQDILNPIGVNVIRSFPAAGVVVWGTRTLATRSDPAYRYVSVRRTAIFLEQSLYNGIQYAVFEPNDEPLWSSLRLNIGAFMMTQFRAGMFQGRTPNDAFFVKCDPTTTTQQDIDLGVVNILVGFAPLKPAEFVVLKLSQKTAQAGA